MSMSDQTNVITEGPVDPKAPTRAKIYAGLGLLFALITGAQVFGYISADQALSLKDWLESTTGLAGAFGFAFVANKTQKQVNNGTFEAAPTNPLADAFGALDQLSTAVTATKAAVDATVDDAKARVADGLAVIQSATAAFPVGVQVADFAEDLIGDLIRDVTNPDSRS